MSSDVSIVATVYELLGISWVMARLVRYEIWAWTGIRGRSKLANLILLSTMWKVWKERNKRAFDEVEDVNGFDILKNRWFQTLIFFISWSYS